MTAYHLDALESRKLFAGGALDATFGSRGVTTATFETKPQYVLTTRQVLSDRAANTYVLAQIDQTRDADADTYQIVRLTAGGDIDSQWVKAKGGFRTRLKFDSGGGTQGVSAALDSADRLLVVVGNTVRRYTDGAADAGFGNGGQITLSGVVRVNQITTDADGHVYLAASASRSGATTAQAVLVRLTADGRLDTTFASRGRYRLPDYTANRHLSVIDSTGDEARVLADGTVAFTAAAGFSTADPTRRQGGFASVRLTAKGRPIGSYGENGIVRVYADPTTKSRPRVTNLQTVRLRPDGSVLLLRVVAEAGSETAGYSQNQILSADGKSRRVVYLAPPGGSPLSTVTGFIDQADGSTLVYGNTLFRVTADDTYAATFNNGTPLAGAAAASLNHDSTVTLAGPSVLSNALLVRRIFRDDRPVASFTGRRLVKPASSYAFTVTYRDADGVRANTITGQELRVTGPDGVARKARLTDTVGLTDDNANTTGAIRATYRLTDPDGNGWDRGDNGTYTVRVLDNRVRDTGGTFLAKRAVGTFKVAIA